MLPAQARMRRRAEFTRAVRGGRRSGRRLITGHLIVRDGVDEPARVGFVVSRAVGGAVVRNTVRRRLRHLARGYLDSLPRGSLLVVRANPPAAAARQADLAAELDLVLGTLLRRQVGALHR
jgi:ribonuclease P protein component